MQISFIRRLDDLGRIVIPKEIRSKLKFNNGDLLDLNINNDCLVIRKSNSSLSMEYVEEIINLVEYLSDYDLILTDSEKVIAKGKKLNDIKINDKISKSLKELIVEHKSEDYLNGVNITEDIFLDGKVYVKVLIKDSNTIGLLIIRVKDNIKDLKLFLNIITKLLLQ